MIEPSSSYCVRTIPRYHITSPCAGELQELILVQERDASAGGEPCARWIKQEL